MLNIIKKILTTWPSTESLKKILLTAEKQSVVVPALDVDRCDDCSECVSLCPTRALKVENQEGVKTFSILGELCIRCGRCVDSDQGCKKGALAYGFRLPVAARRKQAFHQTYRWAEDKYILVEQHHREMPPTPNSVLLGELLRNSMSFRELDSGSCNACELEVNLLTAPQYDAERLGIGCTASPRFADAVLITGPVSRNMKLACERTYSAIPTPKVVIAMGNCAIAGGIYRDSYAVFNGAESIMPVDVYIPGCPPSPPAVIYGLLMAMNRK